MSFDTASLKEFIGEANIYVDVKVPADGTPQEFIAGTPETGLPCDRATPTNPRTCVGLTNGPRTVEYKPEFQGVEVEQTTGEVAPRMVKEAVTVSFQCAAATWQNLQRALQTATATLTNGATHEPNKETLHVGGLSFFDPIAICLVSPLGFYMDTQATPVKHLIYEWVTLYQAMSVDGLKLDYKRNQTRMVKITFTGYADPNRSPGDQLFQIGQDIANP